MCPRSKRKTALSYVAWVVTGFTVGFYVGGCTACYFLIGRSHGKLCRFTAVGKAAQYYRYFTTLFFLLMLAVGQSVASVTCVYCVCLFVHALKRKRLELSTVNLVGIQLMAVDRHALTLRSKGQGHAVVKRTAGVGMHVARTARVFKFLSFFL